MYRWTGYFGGSVYQCSVGGHETKIYFTDGVLICPSVRTTTSLYRRKIAFTIDTAGTDGQGFRGLPHALAITLTTCFTKGFYTSTDGVFISPSVRTDNLALPTVNCLYHRYCRYRWTRFSKATSCPCNNANYLLHQTILNIHRWCIHFSLGRPDNLALPTVSCLYHRYHRYRWTRFSRATSCPCNNANYLIHQTILHIHRWCIHFSIGADGQPRFTDGKLPLLSVPTVPMDKVFEGYLMPLQ